MQSEETNEYTIDIKHFNDLSTRELYQILKARVDVFIVEQNCPYEELDNNDQDCYHLLCKDPKGKIVAVTRIAPAGLIYEEASIGRVVTTKEVRGKGLGIEIMKRSMIFCRDQLKANSIKIAAQLYLKKFYEDLGYEQISEIYPWDGIDHIDMRIHSSEIT
jgi:ElaA protein